MSKKLLSHFQYEWWKYVLAAILIAVVWCSVFSLLAKPADHEQIQMVFFGGDVDAQALTAHLNASIADITTQPLKQITAERQLADATTLHYLVTARVLSADLLIFEEALLLPTQEGEVPMNITSYFLPVSQERLTAAFGDASGRLKYFTLDGQVYGIYLEPTKLSDFISGENRYVLFFSHKSVNCSVLWEESDNGQNAAVDTAKYLLGVG